MAALSMNAVPPNTAQHPSPTFRAAQYNILASYLGNNTEPWFLYGGLTDSEDDRSRAEAIGRKHRERDSDGNYVNVGWPNYVRDILTEEEIAAVERHHAKSFAWEVRAPKIIDVIRDLDVDVLSLVELDQYDEFFRSELEALGLDSVWMKRPRPSSLDGCAVFWRRSKFDLVAHEGMVYSDDIEASRKDRVALVTLLRMISHPDAPLLIFVSTHLARNPESHRQGGIRMRQGAQLMLQVKSFVERHGCNPDVPTILAGDLNAMSFAEMQSRTAAFFFLRGDFGPLKPPPPFWTLKDVPTPPTSYTLLRQCRIDYLLYSDIFLKARPVEFPVGYDSMTIPNDDHPSDHLPISADFQYKTDTEISEDCARRFCSMLLTGEASRVLFPYEVRRAFEHFDCNSSGYVSAEDIANGVRRLALHDGDESVQNKLTEVLRSSQLGQEVTLATFHDALEGRIAQWQNSDPFIQKLFQFIDTDGDGTLSREEMSTYLRTVSATIINDNDFDAIFDSVDLNHDGKIQIDEFVAVFLRPHQCGN